jgi:hypothetical protein
MSNKTVSKCIEVHLTNVPPELFEDFWAWVKRWTANASEATPESSAVAIEINLYLCDHEYASQKEPAHV